MWADNETNQDLLGYQVHADLLKKIILNDEMLPITIGLFGNWGSGKSSLMLLLEDGINNWMEEKNTDKTNEKPTNDTRILQIKFNSWQFEDYDSTKLTLIETILESLKNDINRNRDLFEKIDDLIARINLIEAGIFFLKKATNLLPDKIKEFLPNKKDIDGIIGEEEYNSLLESIQKENSNKIIGQFRKMFERLVLDAKYKAIVVYIDDLDRCAPERIIDCLEAVKLFVNVKKTAFVIGADERIIEYAIQLHYPIEQKKEEISSPFSDFLEKLIQLPYKLPKLSNNEQETYITLLLCKSKLTDSDFKKIHRKYLEFREKDKHSKFNIDNIKKSLGGLNLSSVEHLLEIVPLMNSFLNGNPRQLKRFLNTLEVRLQLAQVAGFDNIRPEVLVKLMVLEYNTLYSQRFEDLYIRQRNGDGYIDFTTIEQQAKIKNKYADTEWGSSWDSDYLRRWILSKPSLQNIKLEDYFWIARDALKNEVPIATLVTSNVMRMYKQLIYCQSTTATHNKLPSIIEAMDNEEHSMLIKLINEDLKNDPKDARCWRILNGDDNNQILSGELQNLKTLLDNVVISEIDTQADSFFFRSKKISQDFAEYISKLVFNKKLTRAIELKEKK